MVIGVFVYVVNIRFALTEGETVVKGPNVTTIRHRIRLVAPFLWSVDDGALGKNFFGGNAAQHSCSGKSLSLPGDISLEFHRIPTIQVDILEDALVRQRMYRGFGVYILVRNNQSVVVYCLNGQV